jgi:signal transduction histidine kinase
VRRWPTFSTSGLDRWAGVVLWPAGIVIGLASERAAFGWDDFSRWLPDLVVGLVFIGCGVQAMSRSRATAVLLEGVGFSWFLANVWTNALFLHRGLLVQLVVAYPGWRPRSRLDLAAVVAGYVAVSLVPVWRSEPATIVLAGALVAVVARSCADARGGLRRARQTALLVTIAFSAALIAGTVLRLRLGDASATNGVAVLYEIVLCGVALVLTSRLPTANAAAVVDLVVELGETRSGTLRDALATTLGDPTLEVGYWDRRSNYLDAEGHIVVVPPADATRSVMFVERGAQPFAVLVHDAAILGEPALVASVAAATRLATVNAELQTVVRDQLAELTASRRRLVSAADEERRRLDDRLRDGAELHLRELDEMLWQEVSGRGSTPARLERAQRQLTQTIEDLRELAAGLHPRCLDRGLAPALETLTVRCPVPVELIVRGGDANVEVRTAIFYVCAEALANIVKHASATSAAIRVTTTTDGVMVEVIDNGAGGADASRGSGLRGLVDRVEVLGGTLSVDSPRSGGTRLIVELPNEPTEQGSCR